MKVLITGSRQLFPLFRDIQKAIAVSHLQVDEIVTPGIQGVGYIVREYAKAYEIPYKEFNIPWLEYGDNAVAIRDKEMTKYSDCMIAFDNSKDSEDIADLMIAQDKLVYRYGYGV